MVRALGFIVREFGLLGLGLAFLALAACAGAKSDATSNYCLSEPRDGFDDYVANHADNIAEGCAAGLDRFHHALLRKAEPPRMRAAITGPEVAEDIRDL